MIYIYHEVNDTTLKSKLRRAWNTICHGATFLGVLLIQLLLVFIVLFFAIGLLLLIGLIIVITYVVNLFHPRKRRVFRKLPLEDTIEGEFEVLSDKKNPKSF